MLDSVVDYGIKLATMVNEITGDLPLPESKTGQGSLRIAALPASVCCLGPLVLGLVAMVFAWRALRWLINSFHPKFTLTP